MRDEAEYLAARAAEAVFSALPGGAARRLGEAVGAMAARPLGLRELGVRRGVVEDQIRRAFPGRGPAWVGATAEACYRHFGREAAELVRLGRLRSSDLVRRTLGGDRVEEVVGDALARGRGAVVVTGHLGNWELAGAFLSGLGIPVTAVVKPQSNPRFDRHLAELRRGMGIGTVSMARAGRRLPEALEAGRVVALVADQDAGSRGVFVPFLGRPASTFRGPARLALDAEAPLLFGALVREGAGYRALVRRVRPGDGGDGPAVPPDGAARSGSETALTRRWVALLEEEVRRRPTQYFWFHRRWKTRPPGSEGGAAGRDPKVDRQP